MKDLVFRMRHARRRAGLSQSALAEMVNVNRSAVAQWERARGSLPTSGNLAKVAISTSVSYEWLATGRGDISIGGQGCDNTPAMLLQYYAHDEVEERVLAGLRKMAYWQSIAIAQLVESLGQGESDGALSDRVPGQTQRAAAQGARLK